jgi:transposase-like protein
MDLIPRGERRRRWTSEQKQMIAAESLSAGASATDIARLHGISTGQLYFPAGLGARRRSAARATGRSSSHCVTWKSRPARPNAYAGGG